MKPLIATLKEGFFTNVGIDPHMYNNWYAQNGFQFGWSAGISGKDWWPIFDMNYVKNTYFKYFDLAKVSEGIPDSFDGTHRIYKKYDRNTRGQEYFGLCENALYFMVLNTGTPDPTDQDIKKQVSKFLNKEKGADKDTEIIITHNDDWSGRESIKVTIINHRLFPQGKRRPLYMIFWNKECVRKEAAKEKL